MSELKIGQTYIRTFDQCEYSAKLYKELGGESHIMLAGRAGHKTVEECTKAMLANGEVQIPVDDAKAILQEVTRDIPVPARYLDQLRVMVHHFATHFRVPSFNCRVELPLAMYVGAHMVRGIVDLLWVEGDTLHIRDYKFGWNLPKQEDISGSDNGRLRGARASQLITYALLAAYGNCANNPEVPYWEIPRGVNKFDVAFIYPAFATDEFGMAERGVTIERPELIEHMAWLETVVHRIARARRTGEYKAIPGSHCSMCAAPKSCPLPREIVPGLSPFEEDPEQVALRWLAHKNEASRLQDELKAYANEFGPIDVGSDQELSFKTVTSKRLSKEGEQAREEGRPIPADAYKESISTRFELRKKAA